MSEPTLPNLDPAGRRAFRPGLTLAIAACWLLLQGSVALPDLLAAVAIGLVVPRLVPGIVGPRWRLGRGRAVLGLLAVVLYDIVAANLTVAWIVLNPRSRPNPAWIRVPYALAEPNAVVLLATIITSTPGTVSCAIDEARREILVHALDCDDPAAMVADMRGRYEARLKEIFG